MKRFLARLFAVTIVAAMAMVAIAYAQRGSSATGETADGSFEKSPTANDVQWARGENESSQSPTQTARLGKPRSSYPDYRGAADLSRVVPAQYVTDDGSQPVYTSDDDFPSADEALGEPQPLELDEPVEGSRRLNAGGPSLEVRGTSAQAPRRSAGRAAQQNGKRAAAPPRKKKAAGMPATDRSRPHGAAADGTPTDGAAADEAADGAAAAKADPFNAKRQDRYARTPQEPARLSGDPADRQLPAASAGDPGDNAGVDAQFDPGLTVRSAEIGEQHIPDDKQLPPARQNAADAPFDDQDDQFGHVPGQDEAAATGLPGVKELEGLQTPSITIEKTAPAEIQVGIPATFTIRVRNTGSITANQVEVLDELPQGTRLLQTRPEASQSVDGGLIWALGTIKPGEEVAIEVDLMPMAEGQIGSVATVHFAAQASASTVCTRPELAVEVSGPREVLIDEEVTLQIKVSNPGSGTARGVVLSESIPEGLEHPAGSELEYEIGDLQPGETRELNLTMKAAAPGLVVNLLSAQGEGPARAEGQAEFEIVAPALELAMDGPKRRYLERQATYTVMVSNPGTASAKDVELVTHLPKGFKFVEANNAGEFDPQTNSVHWLLEELPPQETGQVTLTALPIEAGEQTLRVEGTAQRGLAAEKEEVILIEGVAAILFQVVDVADPIEIGGETTYEIRVVNQGSKAANNVELVAVLPAEMKPVGAEGPTRHQVDGQQVRFAPLERLAPKADTTYRLRVQGLEPGDLRIRVQLLTDEIRTPVTKEESTRVYADE